jgi:hypothetical protein
MAASLPHRTGSYEKLEDCQTEVQDLRAQVQTRPEIKQAKGSLIAKHRCTSERAFQMLAEASELRTASSATSPRRWSKAPKPARDTSRCRGRTSGPPSATVRHPGSPPIQARGPPRTASRC